jgi:hypothetical protein
MKYGRIDFNWDVLARLFASGFRVSFDCYSPQLSRYRKNTLGIGEVMLTIGSIRGTSF